MKSLPAARASERRRVARHSRLAGLIVLSIALIVGLGVWDARREAEEALRDFEREQTAAAVLVGAGVAMQLDRVRSEALQGVGGDQDPGHGRSLHQNVFSAVSSSASRPTAPAGNVVVSILAGEGQRIDVVVPTALLLSAASAADPANLALIRPPGERGFYAASGARFESPPLLAALNGGRAATRLLRPEAAALGLPERIAIVGTTSVGAGKLGRWGVAVVASAGREKDRQARAQWRLVIGVLLAGGLVLGFGGYALRAQRTEFELLTELTVADLEQRREGQLERDSRAATMLTLAAGVAHEISTPLSVIHGRAEQVLARAGDAPDGQAARRILEQATRIERVIRGFLKLARGDAPNLERIDPAEVVREAIALVEHRFAKAGVRLTTSQAGDLPAVRGDRQLLEHALVNLLLNACDASERGGSVRVAALHDAAADMAVFEVDDDGPGITPGLAAHVTEPFFSTKPPGQGSGLGLAIASEIVKIHRGALALAPRETRGTRATVSVPIANGVSDAGA